MKKAFLGLFILCLPLSVARSQSVINRISIDFHSDGSSYIMRIHTDGRQPKFSDPVLLGSNGMTVTIYDSALSENYTPADAAGPVMAYSIGALEGDVVVRLFFVSDSVESRAYRDESGADILIAFSENPIEQPVAQNAGFVGSSTANSSESSSNTTSNTAVTGSALPASTYSGVTNNTLSVREAMLSAVRKLSNKEVTGPVKTVKSANRWKLDTIVLDAGHGGWNNGAVSRAGLKEKDLSLSVAKILGQMLKQDLGIQVEYTRTTDVFIPLAERGRIANQSGGKLFISIHANSSGARSARGTETYFLGIHRSDSARVVMERENKVVEYESDADAYLHMDSAELATKRLTQSAYLQQSEKLAAMIQSQFTDEVGRRNRGVKQAGFYVLFGASMPSVLVELGFLSNTREAGYLGSGEGQVQMARAIFQAITLFKGEYEKSLNVTKL